MSSPRFELERASQAWHWDEVRTLLGEYSESLAFDLRFQHFEEELASVESMYSPPAGLFLLALAGAEVAGCVALRRFDECICEMKRLYLRPPFRGCGLGRRLAEAVIAEGRSAGYRSMRLDTVPSMESAMGLYRSLGFVEIPEYYHNPVPGALYMELELG